MPENQTHQRKHTGLSPSSVNKRCEGSVVRIGLILDWLKSMLLRMSKMVAECLRVGFILRWTRSKPGKSPCTRVLHAVCVSCSTGFRHVKSSAVHSATIHFRSANVLHSHRSSAKLKRTSPRRPKATRLHRLSGKMMHLQAG